MAGRFIGHEAVLADTEVEGVVGLSEPRAHAT